MTRGKKSILVAALVLALCAAMLFGATVAWFTKSTSTGENTIKVADYNVALKYATTWDAWSDLIDSAQLFIATGDNPDDALKPGDKTDVKYIKIINNNNYPIKATVDIGAITQAVTGGTEEIDPTKDALKLYALTEGVNGSSDTLTEVSANTTTTDGKTFTLNNISVAAATTTNSTTTPGTAVIAIQFKLPEEAKTPSVSNTFTIEVKTEQVPTATTPTT